MLRNIVHLLSGERGRLLLRLIEAQEDFFQGWLTGCNVCRVMVARDANDLGQCTLDVQLQGTLICSLSHSGHARDMVEPVYRGWARKTDLDIVLADLFERRDMTDLDQSPFADDRDAVAGMLDLRQNVRGSACWDQGPDVQSAHGHRPGLRRRADVRGTR